MRFPFKTSYEQDIRLFRDAVAAQLVPACSPALLLLPLLMPDYLSATSSLVFIYGALRRSR